MGHRIDATTLLPDASGPFYPVKAPLDEVISHFYHLSHPANEEPAIHQLSPNLEMLIAFNFGTPVEIVFPQASSTAVIIERSAVIGPLRQLMQYTLHRGADVLLINFKFNGFHRVFSHVINDAHQTGITHTGGIIPDHGLLEDWWQELASATVIQQRITHFTALISAALSVNDELENDIIANNELFYDPKLDPAKAFADNNGVSQRAIQLRFQHTVGYSVKELLRYLRFKAVLAALAKCELKKPDLMAIVEKHNYHDQSHLNKDFKHFSGMSPLQFYKQLKSGNICINTDTYQKS